MVFRLYTRVGDWDRRKALAKLTAIGLDRATQMQTELARAGEQLHSA